MPRLAALLAPLTPRAPRTRLASLAPLTALGLLALLPPNAARAEEPATTYDLHTWQQTWKVGDVRTRQMERTMTMAMVIEPAGGPAQRQTMTQQQSSTVVQKCLAVDEQKRCVKSLVWVREWRNAEGEAEGEAATLGEPDASVQGLHLEVTWNGKTHEYKVLTPDAKPSEEGQEWLNEEYGTEADELDGDGMEKLGRPEGPVKVGDTWKGDPGAIPFDFPLNLEASSVHVTLAGVENGLARMPVKMRLQLQAFPLAGLEGGLPWVEGGALEFDAEFTQSLAPATYDGGLSVKGGLKGVAARKALVSVQMELALQMVGTSKGGGEMPAVPSAAEAKPAEPVGVK